MGAFLGLLAGLGVLLVWHGLTARPSLHASARPVDPHPRTPDPGRPSRCHAGPADRAAGSGVPAGRCAGLRAHPVHQRHGRLRAVRGQRPPAGRLPAPAQTAGGSARTVARGGGQPHLRCAGRPVAAGGAVRDRRPRTRTTAGTVQAIRLRLPHHRPVQRLPRSAQGRTRRPGRRPGLRIPAGRPRGRRHRSRPTAVDPVRVPAGRRPDQGRAPRPAVVVGERRTDGGGRAVAGADPAGHPAGDPAGLRHPDRHVHPGRRAPCCRWSPTG